MKNKYKLPKTIVVNRAKWLHGGRKQDSVLCDKAKRMCCLGFAAEQSGVDKDILYNSFNPADMANNTEAVHVPGLTNVYTSFGYKGTHNSNFSEEAISINDDEELTLVQRERALQKLARKYKRKFRFTGKYPRDAKDGKREE